MGKVILNIKKKIKKIHKQKGVSMISLVITIIVMIILTAVAYGSSMQTVDEADYSKYVTEFNGVATAFEETSLAVKGEKNAAQDLKTIEQVYNYVAKAAKDDGEFLVMNQLPGYTIIKDEKQIGIELPKMTLESGTGKRIQAKFATTKNGEVFMWPPYEFEQKLYISPNSFVEHRLQNVITVGKETIEIEIDPIDGSLVEINQENIQPPIEDETPEVPENNPAEEHYFTSKTPTSEYLYAAATCTSPAVYYYKCLQCDKKGTETYTSGAPLNHDYGNYRVEKAANCGSTGVEKRTCIRCNNAETRTIAKNPNNHVGEKVSKITKAATCTEEGVKKYTCATCNAELGTEAIEALQHSYGEYEVTKEPNCVEKGIRTKTCSRCKDEQTQEIAKNPNNHHGGEIIKSTVNATCTVDGEITSKCSLCNATLNTEVIEAGGHDFDQKKVSSEYLKSEATTSEPAYYYYSCSKCNAKGTDSFKHGDPLDADGPTLTVTAPLSEDPDKPSYSTSTSYTVTGTATDSSGVKSVTANGVNATVSSNGSWTCKITIEAQTTNEVTIIATDKTGKTTTLTRYVHVDDIPPVIELEYPLGTTQESPLYLTSRAGYLTHALRFKATDEQTGLSVVEYDGLLEMARGRKTFSVSVGVIENIPADRVSSCSYGAEDRAGNFTDGYVYFFYDATAPVVTISNVSGTADAPTVVNTSAFVVQGTATDAGGIKTLMVNGTEVTVDENGNWSTTINLVAGETREISVVATDRAGRTTTALGYVKYEEANTEFSFTIYDKADKTTTTYYATPGMTWKEWANSEFDVNNSFAFWESGNCIFGPHRYDNALYYSSNDELVDADDLIINGGEYYDDVY